VNGVKNVTREKNANRKKNVNALEYAQGMMSRSLTSYGVASISRLLQIIGLFCKRAL